MAFTSEGGNPGPAGKHVVLGGGEVAAVGFSKLSQIEPSRPRFGEEFVFDPDHEIKVGIF
jgi:hypothetical protein